MPMNSIFCATTLYLAHAILQYLIEGRKCLGNLTFKVIKL